MNSWLQSRLACPVDHLSLTWDETGLRCPQGHHYPCVDGIPVLLRSDMPPTHPAFQTTLATVAGQRGPPPAPVVNGGIDPFVQDAIVGTCGNLYTSLRGRLPRYPIPDLRLPAGNGQSFLDIGCNWGRWCVAAARKGYRPVGIDPSLDALIAARRVSTQLGIVADYLVADSRFLPFSTGCFDVVFSYSVLQHLSKENARLSITEIGRVLQPGGRNLVQMPNAYGLHNLWVQLRTGIRQPGLFDVRYWRPAELRALWEESVGPTTLSVDGFFSLNAQASDLDLMSPPYRLVIRSSEWLRTLSARLPFLLYLADSLYVDSIRSVGEATAG